MNLTHDFVADLESVLTEKEPFAFSRFGDGEWRWLTSEQHRHVLQHEQWWTGTAPKFRDELQAAFEYQADGYHVGIMPWCCHGPSSNWYKSKIGNRPSTFATLFCHGNYDAFLSAGLRSRSVLVSSAGGDFTVPSAAINTKWDLDGLISALGRVDRPILVAAGPMACVIVHRYWAAGHRGQILDVGSAYDPEIHGHWTRSYHDPGHASRRHRCAW